MTRKLISAALCATLTFAFSCVKPTPTPDPTPDVPDTPDVPIVDPTITPYDGEMATDGAEDIVGTDADFYWEANNFSNTVTVQYNGSEATVTSSSNKVLAYQEGAHVVLDLLTNSVKNVEIILAGSSEDGSLKVYGEKKYKLTLSGVNLTSTKGPAINNQCKKRVFLHLTEGTVNVLKDAKNYTDDIYYPQDVVPASEDRKGCFFSEGNLLFSGKGVLQLSGESKHAIATDGYFWMRPGVTIVVTEAAKSAISVKGDVTDNIGITINGGLIHALVSSPAGKCVSCDHIAEINGGRLLLQTSGNTIYDSSAQDTSSPTCMKVDGDVTITGGELTLKASGSGGKGLSTDAALHVVGGTLNVSTSGAKYTYSSSVTACPKGIKADGDITIDGGVINVSATGKNDGAEGIESKANLTINGGEIYVQAYDDAINAATSLVINGGKVYCLAEHNDGLDSNGKLTINGGLVISTGDKTPEESFDSDYSQNFTVNGGTLIGIAGATTTPYSTSTQNSLIYGGLTATQNQILAIKNSAGETILAYRLHRSLSGYTLFVSDPRMENGSYTIHAGGEVTGEIDSWNGYYYGGTYTGGSQIGSFTVSGVVTTVGSTGGGPGGPGGPGGGRPR